MRSHVIWWHTVSLFVHVLHTIHGGWSLSAIPPTPKGHVYISLCPYLHTVCISIVLFHMFTNKWINAENTQAYVHIYMHIYIYTHIYIYINYIYIYIVYINYIYCIHKLYIYVCQYIVHENMKTWTHQHFNGFCFSPSTQTLRPRQWSRTWWFYVYPAADFHKVRRSIPRHQYNIYSNPEKIKQWTYVKIK